MWSRAWLLVAALVAALAIGGAAQSQSLAHKPWVASIPDEQAVDLVWTYINAKDCAAAAKALSDGAAKGYPGLLLLAGAMFEDGVCLKPNWQRAEGFYQRAQAAGHPRAAAKLASGYMTAAAGPDKAAALWWALGDQRPLPSECLSVASLVNDADRFVQALQAWPAQRLDGCAYTAAVLSTLIGDMEFSSRAAAHGMKGELKLTYQPALERFSIDTSEIEFIRLGGVVSGDAIRDRESMSVRGEFERDIRTAADRALKRYTKPAGIDPTWQVAFGFTFQYVAR